MVWLLATPQADGGLGRTWRPRTSMTGRPCILPQPRAVEVVELLASRRRKEGSGRT